MKKRVLNVKIDDNIYRQFKVAVAMEGCQQGELVERALAEFMDNHEVPKVKEKITT